MSEEEMIRRVMLGDQAASLRFYKAHYAVVARICRRMAPAKDAEDLIQETFLRILLRLSVYTPNPAGITGWIKTITRNLCLNKLRRAYRSREIALSDHEMDWPVMATDRLAWFDYQKMVVKVSQSFGPTFELYVDGWTHQEIAEELGVALVTVRTRVRKARQQILAAYRREQARAERLR